MHEPQHRESQLPPPRGLGAERAELQRSKGLGAGGHSSDGAKSDTHKVKINLDSYCSYYVYVIFFLILLYFLL